MKKKSKVSRWEHTRLLFNDDRREIVDRCRAQAKSIQDLAREMNLNPGSVHNHVHKLFDAGFLAVESTRVINGITERKYRRTGAFFSMFHIEPEAAELRNKALVKLAGKRVSACLERGPRPSALYDVNIRTNRKQLARIKKLAEALRLAIIEADGSGDIPVSSFVVIGQTKDRRKKGK